MEIDMYLASKFGNIIYKCSSYSINFNKQSHIAFVKKMRNPWDHKKHFYPP